MSGFWVKTEDVLTLRFRKGQNKKVDTHSRRHINQEGGIDSEIRKRRV